MSTYRSMLVQEYYEYRRTGDMCGHTVIKLYTLWS